MKRILITGANSYVGTNVEKWLRKEPENYQVDTIDMIDGSWRHKDFSGYDVVLHVAGIAHVKETKKNRDLFYKINRDLSIEVATVVKNAGISQFIFLSSMSVYGIETGRITEKTIPRPKNSYGKSKFEAEVGILSLASSSFKIAILRPPMIYGFNCKGNFQNLLRIVQAVSIFPKVKNQRSMIYIKNLNIFIQKLIELKEEGVFLPQNPEYVCTTDMASLMARNFGKKFRLSTTLGLLVKLCIPFNKTCKKSFGNFYYDYESSRSTKEHISFEDSIRLSIKEGCE